MSDHEYKLFYQNTFRDFKDPLAWHHFSGASDDGIGFKAIVFIPSNLYVDLFPDLLLANAFVVIKSTGVTRF